MTWVDVIGWIVGGVFVLAVIGSYIEERFKEKKK